MLELKWLRSYEVIVLERSSMWVDVKVIEDDSKELKDQEWEHKRESYPRKQLGSEIFLLRFQKLSRSG